MTTKRALDQVKRMLVKKLFSTKILNRNDVTIAEISRVSGDSIPKIYRLLKKFGFDTHNKFRNDKSPEEIADLVWKNLTGEEIERLYDWVRYKRFDVKKDPQKRSYVLSDEGREKLRERRVRTEKDDSNDQAMNVALIKNSGIPQIQPTPTAKTAKALPQGTESKLHNFVTTDDSTDNQVSALLKSILLGTRPTDETVAAMVKLATSDDEFNAKQWAFNELFNRSVQEARSAFMKQALTSDFTKGESEQTDLLINAYLQNLKAINLDGIGD